MHDMLRDRILRNLEALPEERLYQVLDYIEFLGSRYNREGIRPAASPLQAFSERLEDKLRVNRVGMSAIRGTMGMLGAADRVVNGISEVGRSVLRDVGAPAAGPRPTRSIAPPQHERPAPRVDRGTDDIPVDG